MLVLFVCAMLVGIQVSNIGAMMEESRMTSLGDYGVDLTFGINLALLISTFILASNAISECMNCLLTERKSELNMYHTIGWTHQRILYKVAKEAFGWVVLSVLIGLLFSGATLLLFGTSIKWILIGCTISFWVYDASLFQTVYYF